MNTVIFLTQENKGDMAETISRLSEMQDDMVNGALVACHHSSISNKEAMRILAPLSQKYTTGALVSTSTNTKMSLDGQIAVMFTRFAALAYNRFPGPWLVIDAPTAPKVRNWAVEIGKIHRKLGGRSCGMAKQEGKSWLSYGPITLQFHTKVMRLLHFSNNESWRSRGRFLLTNNGFARIEPSDSIFTDGLSEVDSAPPASESADPVDDSQNCDMMERTMLSAQIEKTTGKKPHHFTSLSKLREMAAEIQPIE